MRWWTGSVSCNGTGRDRRMSSSNCSQKQAGIKCLKKHQSISLRQRSSAPKLYYRFKLNSTVQRRRMYQCAVHEALVRNEEISDGVLCNSALMLQLLLLLHYQSPLVTSALRRKKHPNYIFFPACFSFRDLIESILFSLTLSFVLCIQSISSSDVIFLSFISSSSSRIGREKRWIAFDRVPLSHWLRRHTITHIVHTCIIFSAPGADDKYSALWISHPSCFPAAKRQFLLLFQTRSLKCRPNKAGGVDS